MRVEMVFHTYVEVFNRLFSVRFDATDWLFKITNTPSTTMVYVGPLHLGYTNQNTLNERIKEMIANFEQDFANYQVADKSEPLNTITVDSSNIIH